MDVNLEDDPVSLLVNFFDISIVFALGFMVLALAREAPGPSGVDDYAREHLSRQGIKLERYRATKQKLTGEGERLGVAYRLTNGEVVYVPDPEAETSSSPARRPVSPSPGAGGSEHPKK